MSHSGAWLGLVTGSRDRIVWLGSWLGRLWLGPP